MGVEARLDLLDGFLRNASDELGLPVTDVRVIQQASLLLAHAVATEHCLAGARGSAEALTNITELLAKSAPPPKQRVELEIVRSRDTAPADGAAVSGLVQCRRCHWKPEGDDRVSRCYRCGWKHGDDTKKPWSPPLGPPSDAKIIEGEIVPGSAASARTRTALPPPKAKQDVKPERHHVGGIHDQPGARMRVHDEPWRGHVGTVDNP